MIVVDTSAFVSITIGDVLTDVVNEYDVHTTEQVFDELNNTADYDDVHGAAADHVLSNSRDVTVHDVDDSGLRTSRIDAGEASCVHLAEQRDADFVITDDLRALPELQQLTDARVAISPILFRALVKRNVLTNREARATVDHVAASRDWLGAPTYRRAQRLFDE
ncbi:MAG: hypothetical protein ABEI96_03890 [Haloarculaceae archaeon]